MCKNLKIFKIIQTLLWLVKIFDGCVHVRRDWACLPQVVDSFKENSLKPALLNCLALDVPWFGFWRVSLPGSHVYVTLTGPGTEFAYTSSDNCPILLKGAMFYSTIQKYFARNRRCLLEDAMAGSSIGRLFGIITSQSQRCPSIIAVDCTVCDSAGCSLRMPFCLIPILIWILDTGYWILNTMVELATKPFWSVAGAVA